MSESKTATDLQSQLLTWYAKHQRDLPWRKTRDPYQIWLSETLLQQTQVSRGLLYFERFLTAFPSVQALAAAPLEAVLKAWEGAGYYARARNLHKAAQQMVQEGWPEGLEGWLALPGVGPYTAGAILSIAFGQAVPVVDGNVRRVLARWFAQAQPSENWLWQTARALLEPSKPGDWNQALMELGATVCTPKKPACASCPVQAHCQAWAGGLVARVPAAKTRAEVKQVQAVAVVISDGHGVLLEQRPQNALLGGMFGVPIVEPERLVPWLRSHGLDAAVPRSVGTIRHAMTHRHFELEVMVVFAPEYPGLLQPQTVALAKLDQKILAQLEANLFATN